MVAHRPDVIVAMDKSKVDDSDATLMDLFAKKGLWGIKVGLEATHTNSDVLNLSVGRRLITFAEDSGLNVMLDLKLTDISNTISRTLVTLLNNRNVSMFTVMAESSSRATLKQAAKIADDYGSLALGVTLLTDIDDAESEQDHGGNREVVVTRLAQKAFDCGIRALVCSAREIPALPPDIRTSMIFVTPGIRPVWHPANDQQATATPAEAMRNGAHKLVIGRPITNPDKAVGGPSEAIDRIVLELNQAA